MLSGQSDTLFYIVKTDDDKYSLFNILTDKIILNDVTKKEIKKFLETNNPMHPSLVYSNPGDPLGISFQSPILSPMEEYKEEMFFDSFKLSDTFTYDLPMDGVYSTSIDFTFDSPHYYETESLDNETYWSDYQNKASNSEDKSNVYSFTKKRRLDDYFDELIKNKNEDDDKN